MNAHIWLYFQYVFVSYPNPSFHSSLFILCTQDVDENLFFSSLLLFKKCSRIMKVLFRFQKTTFQSTQITFDDDDWSANLARNLNHASLIKSLQFLTQFSIFSLVSSISWLEFYWIDSESTVKNWNWTSVGSKKTWNICLEYKLFSFYTINIFNDSSNFSSSSSSFSWSFLSSFSASCNTKELKFSVSAKFYSSSLSLIPSARTNKHFSAHFLLSIISFILHSLQNIHQIDLKLTQVADTISGKGDQHEIHLDFSDIENKLETCVNFYVIFLLPTNLKIECSRISFQQSHNTFYQHDLNECSNTVMSAPPFRNILSIIMSLYIIENES